MMSQEIKVETVAITEIAAWLRAQAGTWWAIDGDQRLESRIEMPATNQDLASALEKFCNSNEELDVLVPSDGDSEGIARLVSGSAGSRRLTANGGDDDDGWILVEQTDWVEAANAEVEAGTTVNT